MHSTSVLQVATVPTTCLKGGIMGHNAHRLGLHGKQSIANHAENYPNCSRRAVTQEDNPCGKAGKAHRERLKIICIDSPDEKKSIAETLTAVGQTVSVLFYFLK